MQRTDDQTWICPNLRPSLENGDSCSILRKLSVGEVLCKPAMLLHHIPVKKSIFYHLWCKGAFTWRLIVWLRRISSNLLPQYSTWIIFTSLQIFFGEFGLCFWTIYVENIFRYLDYGTLAVQLEVLFCSVQYWQRNRDENIQINIITILPSQQIK